MSFHRMKSVLFLAGFALPCAFAHAITSPKTLIHEFTIDPAAAQINATQTPSSGTLLIAAPVPGNADLGDVDIKIADALQKQTPQKADAAAHPSGARRLLADFAMTLRNIRYHRGGREPSTGFDCSGFVRYVYQHTIGKELPSDSAGQYMVGEQVSREAMKPGDLVFFRTHGRRISHVGIYLDHGRFIHSPSSGKRVSISRLDEVYWAKRFVGAKRPKVLS